MSQNFMLAACSVPLAYYSNGYIHNMITHYHNVALEKTWREPFRQWLENIDTANTIMHTIYAPDFFDTDSGWGEAILNYLEDADPIVDDPDFIAYCDTLDEEPYISDDDPDEYVNTILACISSHFLDAAHNAFVGNHSEATLHRGQLITAGPSWGNPPTKIFHDVELLSYITFFDDYPIAKISNGTVTGWVDHDGNPVNPPQHLHDSAEKTQHHSEPSSHTKSISDHHNNFAEYLITARNSKIYNGLPEHDFINDASSTEELSIMENIKSWEELRDYLLSRSAPPEVINPARNVWDDYAFDIDYHD